MIYITSDLHLYHSRMLKFRKEKGLLDSSILTNSDFMELLEKNWNEVVSKDDVVINLGDLSFRRKSVTESDEIDECKDYIKIFRFHKKLNGRKILLLGNHDREFFAKTKSINLDSVSEKYAKVLKTFREELNEAFENVEETAFGANGFVFTHEVEPNIIPGAVINIHGHIHHGLTNEIMSGSVTHFNANIELNEFKPVSLDDIMKTLEERAENHDMSNM